MNRQPDPIRAPVWRLIFLYFVAVLAGVAKLIWMVVS